MLEFIFFHHNICKLFTDFIAEQSIEYQVSDDGDNITVSVSEDVDDTVIEPLEEE